MDIQHQLVVLNGNIDGSPARLVNARPLHAFLGVRREIAAGHAQHKKTLSALHPAARPSWAR